jgi:hypothetical protein
MSKTCVKEGFFILRTSKDTKLNKEEFKEAKFLSLSFTQVKILLVNGIQPKEISQVLPRQLH